MARRVQRVDGVPAPLAAGRIVEAERGQLLLGRPVARGDGARALDGRAPRIGRALEVRPRPQAVHDRAELRAQVRVGHAGLQARVRCERRVVARVPQGERQDTHQRAVAVAALLGRDGIERGRAARDRPQRLARLDANVEHPTVDGEVALERPAAEARREVLRVEAPGVEQGVEHAERHRAVVRPRGCGRVRVGPREAPRRLELDLRDRRQRSRPMKLVRDAQRVAHEQSEQTSYSLVVDHVSPSCDRRACRAA